MEALKEKAIRGGAAKLAGQLVVMALRLGSLVVLARLLDPSDFGLVAMVTVVTSVFDIFVTGGLSAATIRHEDVTDAQISTLFWINVAIGALLAVLCVVIAPFLNVFYHEPRASHIIIALAPAFIINGMGVQHVALLQRNLRYVTLSAIEVASQVASAAISIGMALAGFGYWSLVASVIAVPACLTIGAWIATKWVPGLPRRDSGISSMLRFGGTVSLNGLVVYAAYNLEKVLLGRYFGADALGLYGRAYQLAHMPTQALNTALGGVTFAALARLQREPARFKNYFLKGYSLIVSITLPTTIFCAVLADDIILVVLGPKWQEAATIFRLLAPTILVFGIINPLGWLLQSIGLQERSLKIALVIAPLVGFAYLIGIPFGPNGVALAYSAAMMLWLIPHVLWCLYGTPIAPSDLLFAAGRPLLSGAAAACAAIFIQHLVAGVPSPVIRLALAGGAMFAVYAATLLFVMNQKALYLDVLQGLQRTPVHPKGGHPELLRQRSEPVAP